MVGRGKCLVANNFICHLNKFLELRNHPILELANKKNSVEKSTSAKKLKLESVNDSPTVQNNSFSNLDLDLYNLQLLKKRYHLNLFINHLNINSLSNKIDAWRQICKISPLKIVSVNENNLERQTVRKGAKCSL